MPDRSVSSATLVDEALLARRVRLDAALSKRVPESSTNARERLRAALMVERMLSARSLPPADCSRFLGLLAGRLHMASGVIREMLVSIAPMTMLPRRVRALALIVADLVAFIEASVARDGKLRVYLAVGFDGGELVVAVGAGGDVGPVASAGATRSFLRARAIVELMGGSMDRGIDRGRMVIGITFPAEMGCAL